MLLKAVIVTLAGCLLSLEQNNGQFGFARPLVAGTLIGIVLGEPALGVTLGAEMQLIFMGVTPVGAAVPPDYLIGTVVATALAILTGQGVELALSLAVPVAIAGQSVNILGRTVNTGLNHWADRCAENGDYKKLAAAHYLGGLVTAARTAVVVFPAIYFGVDAAEYLLSILPEKLLTGLSAAGSILPVVGFGMLLNRLGVKWMLPFFFLGFVLSTFGGFSLVGASIVAVCIALLYDHFAWGKKSPEKSTEKAKEGNEAALRRSAAEADEQDGLDELDELMK